MDKENQFNFYILYRGKDSLVLDSRNTAFLKNYISNNDVVYRVSGTNHKSFPWFVEMFGINYETSIKNQFKLAIKSTPANKLEQELRLLSKKRGLDLEKQETI